MALQPAEWTRTTRRADSAELSDDARAQIAELEKWHGVELHPADPLACVHTVSEPVRRGFLRRNKPVETTLVLTAELLFVVARVEGREHVMVYRLSEIEVRPFASELIADVGLELSGTQIGASERSVAFLPVDEGPDGSGFRTALGAALERARVG